MDGGDNTLVRATLTGGIPAVTLANNKGIWQCDPSLNKRQALVKGQTIGLAGLKIAKVINVWGAQRISGVANTKVLVLVQLAGPGVSAANDQALLLTQEGNTGATPKVDILMREGDPAQGCGTGTISRVNVDAYCGGYLILATLAGAPAGTELALYAGRLMDQGYGVVGNSTTTSIIRRPVLFLRKGWQYDGQPSKIKSIYLPASNLTASGFGATGRQNNISYFNDIAITVEFDNGVKQIMSGGIP